MTERDTSYEEGVKPLMPLFLIELTNKDEDSSEDGDPENRMKDIEKQFKSVNLMDYEAMP